MSKVEEPAYTVIAKDGSIETRAYGPMVAAEVEVTGERRAAISDGFRMIAGYIFGANGPKTKIAMTAPVEQQKRDGEAWRVRFIMPRDRTLDRLPTPDDSRIRLGPIPARRMVVIRFAGRNSDELIAAKTEDLLAYASRQHLRTTGEPVLAFYNPPWTLPWFRRNEIMLALAEPERAVDAE